MTPSVEWTAMTLFGQTHTRRNLQCCMKVHVRVHVTCAAGAFFAIFWLMRLNVDGKEPSTADCIVHGMQCNKVCRMLSYDVANCVYSTVYHMMCVLHHMLCIV